MSKFIRLKQVPSTLALYIKDAELLIHTAAESVNSFFVSKNHYIDTENNFIGFLQDSLVGEKDFRISTGSVSVVADLYQIERYLQYLYQNGVSDIEKLRQNRNEGRAYIMEKATGDSFSMSKSFVKLSPLTYATCASVANAGKNQEKARLRAALFNGVNLSYFLRGDWPELENVDKPHPFIAYKVQNAVLSLVEKSGLSLTEINSLFSDPDNLLSKALSMPDDKKDAYSKAIKDRSETLRRSNNSVSLEDIIRPLHTKFRGHAERYLAEQIAYLPQSDVGTSYSLLYDPVGTCFALNIFLLSCMKETEEGDLRRIFGEHIGLISRSIKHILEALTVSGSFPYGVPFSYNQDGTAGFATSTNGLTALARFLLELLYYARKSDYPSKEFLEKLLLDNYTYFEKLFALLSLFASTVRRVTVTNEGTKCLKEDLTLLGWSTDRAPNNSRIESWVTIEMFLFAIYLREALQEYVQFFVCRKYSARLPKTEPAWPYSGNEPITRVKGKPSILTDPDEEATLTTSDIVAFRPEQANQSPIQFLHLKFNQFMKNSGNNVTDWKQEVSSVLLFGPPGTAKTTTVKSLAQELEWHYLELSPSDFIIDGMEKIEQRAKEIFEELSLLREAVILFDELDSLFIDREFLEPGSMINFIVPAMLPKLQGLSNRAKKQRLLIVIATNFYDRLDPAMVRQGRIDKHLLVLPFNEQSRVRQLWTFVGEKNKSLLNNDLLDDFKKQSGLYVYEELNAASKLINNELLKGVTANGFKYPASAISPAIYWSRTPNDNEAASRIRSTQRLALEVCEVVGRWLNDERKLSADDNSDRLIKRLEELAGKSSAEWASLCQAIWKVFPKNSNTDDKV